MDKHKAAVILLDDELSQIAINLEKACAVQSILLSDYFQELEPDAYQLKKYYQRNGVLFSIMEEYTRTANETLCRLLGSPCDAQRCCGKNTRA